MDLTYGLIYLWHLLASGLLMYCDRSPGFVKFGNKVYMFRKFSIDFITRRNSIIQYIDGMIVSSSSFLLVSELYLR